MAKIEELEPLLTAPAEALDVEYKTWLDLKSNDEHKAILAKAAIAIANEGGGYIVLGMREERPNLVSEPRPADIAAYDQDMVNQIIRRFASPQFHCTLMTLRHPDTEYEHAVIKVPGGFAFPVMSKSGTPQNSIRPQVCYMRKPGPESAPPENQADWEHLLNRCLRNRREDMLDAIRTIVEGGVPPVDLEKTDAERQSAFVEFSRARWETLTANLDSNAPERCPLGRYELDYALSGDFEQPSLSKLLEVLHRAVVRGASFLLFQIPPQPELQPAPIGDGIECWLNMQAVTRPYLDSAHADFWRASPEGRMFFLRGYVEDSVQTLAGLPRLDLRKIEPGKTFDIENTSWIIGECFLHAANVASLLAPGRDVRVHLQARWYGLAGRRLVSMWGTRLLTGDYICRQDEYAAETIVDLSRIEDNLPEIVGPLVGPLYERFSFFRLPSTLVAEELAKMKSRRF
jgi:transcriptional regulator with XRE-family HTH domain